MLWKTNRCSPRMWKRTAGDDGKGTDILTAQKGNVSIHDSARDKEGFLRCRKKRFRNTQEEFQPQWQGLLKWKHTLRGRESRQAPRATALGPQGRAPFILLGCEKSGFILNYLIPESRGLFLNYPILSSDFLWAVFYHFGSYPQFSRFAHKVGGQNS